MSLGLYRLLLSKINILFGIDKTQGFYKNKITFNYISSTMLTPKESGEFIVNRAKYVKVNKQGVQKLADEILTGILDKTLDIGNFSQNKYHPKLTDSFAIEWIFLIDTLNFCFWKPNKSKYWSINGETGYFALCAGVNRAIKNGVDILNSEFYSKITKEQVLDIFRSDNTDTNRNMEIPLVDERVQCLHEVGKRLLEKFNGKFENCVLQANGSAQELLKVIVTEFPCYRDVAAYQGQEVSIYKRAQILIGDLWACFHGKAPCGFKDINTITMFADYRIPQVFLHFGAMEYDNELMDLLKIDTQLTNGSEMEVEIRGTSIYIVEQIKDQILVQLKENYPEQSTEYINAILLDHFLWDYRRKYADELEHIPYHKTLSIYY